MGCPKSFSISGGMGAALLSKPDLIHDVSNAQKRIPITIWTYYVCLKNYYFPLYTDSDHTKEKHRYTSNMQNSAFEFVAKDC